MLEYVIVWAVMIGFFIYLTERTKDEKLKMFFLYLAYLHILSGIFMGIITAEGSTAGDSESMKIFWNTMLGLNGMIFVFVMIYTFAGFIEKASKWIMRKFKRIG